MSKGSRCTKHRRGRIPRRLCARARGKVNLLRKSFEIQNRGLCRSIALGAVLWKLACSPIQVPANVACSTGPPASPRNLSSNFEVHPRGAGLPALSLSQSLFISDLRLQVVTSRVFGSGCSQCAKRSDQIPAWPRLARTRPRSLRPELVLSSKVSCFTAPSFGASSTGKPDTQSFWKSQQAATAKAIGRCDLAYSRPRTRQWQWRWQEKQRKALPPGRTAGKQTESSIGVALRNQHAFRSRHLSRYLTRRAEASPVHESLQGAKLIRRTESDLETLSKDPDSPIRFRQTPEQEAERVWAQQLRPIF